MHRFRASFSSVRIRLALLVGMAVSLAILLSIYNYVDQRRAATAAAYAEAMVLAHRAAAEEDQLITNARQILAVLAADSTVQRLDPAGCSAMARNLHSPIFTNLGAATPEGNVFCSAVPITSPVNIADRAYFTRTMARLDFSIGEYQVGRITGKPAINLGYPIFDAAGRIAAVVYAGLDLAAINEIIARAERPSGSTLTVIDAGGVVLGRHPDPENWAGKTIQETPLWNAMIHVHGGRGAAQVAGLEGTPRLFGFTVLPSTVATHPLYVAIGIPEATALGGPQRTFVRYLTGLGAAALLMLVITWISANRLVLLPVSRLAAAAARLSHGDLTVRTGLSGQAGELGQLGQAFDEMAGALRRQDAERKRAELTLRESEEHFRSLVEGVKDYAIIMLDPAGRVATWNAGAERIKGYGAREIIGKHFSIFYPTEDVQRGWPDHVLKIATDEGRFEDAGWRVRKDGSRFWADVVITALRDDGRRLRGFSKITRDVTQRRQAEEQLRKLSHAVEQSPSIIVITDTHETIEYVNPRFTQVTGYALAEVIGTPAARLGEPQGGRQQVVETITNGAPWQGEILSARKDGTRYWELASISAIRNASGEIVHYVKAAEDITARKRAEEERRKSDERFGELFENANDIVFSEDMDGNISAINRAGERITGYAREELIGQPVARIIVPEDRARGNEMLQRKLQHGGATNYEIEILTKDGRRVPVEINTRLVYDGERPTGVHGIARDISERKAADARIQDQLQALTALYSSAHRLAQSLNLQELTNYAASTAVKVFGAEWAWVGRAEADGSMRIVGQFPAEGYPAPPTLRWDDAPGGQGPTGQAIRTGFPAVSADLANAAELTADRRTALQKMGLRAEAALPLISRDRPFGVLVLYSKEPEFFSPARVEFLQAFANLVSASLANAQLFEEAGRRLEQLTALRDIDRAITSSLDGRVTLNVFLDKVTTQLRVDAADILLLNPHTQTLEFSVGRGFRSVATRRTSLRLGRGHAGRAALEQKLIAIANLSAEPGEFAEGRLLKDEEFAAYYAAPLVAKGQVKGVLEVFSRQPVDRDAEWEDFLAMLAGQAAIAVDNATLLSDLQRANVDLTLAYDTTLEGWSRALDLRDKETEGHTQRVAELTLRLARAMSIAESDLVHIRRGALLHDIGKMGIPDSILLKPDKLTEDEWQVMRRHPVHAHDLLAPIAHLRPALDIPYAHHEKWDGTGYPRGLKGDQIPLAARIFAIIDVWDALTSDRPYQQAWSKEKARAYITEQSGRHFDPRVVEAFLALDL